MKARWVVLGGILVVPPLGVGGLLLGLRSTAGQAWVIERVIALVQPAEGLLTVRSVRTDLWSTLRIEGVSLRDRSGKELAGLDVAQADFSLRELLAGRVRVSRLSGEGLRGDITIDSRGVDIANIWGPPSTAPSQPWSGLGIDLLVERVEVSAPHAQVRIDGEVIALAGIELDGVLGFVGDTILLDDLELRAASTTPALGELRVAGGMRYGPAELAFDSAEIDLGPHYASLAGALGADDDVGIQLGVLHVDLDALPWELPVHGAYDLTGEIGGRLDAPAVTLLVGTPGGTVDAVAGVDLRGDRPVWQARVDTIGLEIDALVDGVPEVVVDLALVAEGAGLTWPDDLEAYAVVAATAPVAGPVGSATLDTTLEVGDGVAWVRELVATTPTGALSADATVDLLARAGTVTVHALDVTLRDLRRFGVGGLGGEARLAGQVDGAWIDGEPELRFVGDLDARGLRYQDTARVSGLRGPLVVQWADRSATYSADLRAHGLGASTTKLQRARLSARGTATQAGAIRLTARVHGDTFAAGPATVASLDARAQLARSSRGYLQTDVLFTTGAIAASTVAGDRASGSLSIAGDALLATVDVFDVERTVVGVDASGAIAAGHYEIPRLVFSPDPTQTWTGAGVQTVTLAADGVDDLRVLVESGDASIGATGRVHTRGDSAVDVAVTNLPLTMLAALDPAFVGYAGTVGIVGNAAGTWQDLDLTVSGKVAGLVIPGAVRDLDATLGLDGNDGVLTVAADVSSRGEGLATARGTLPVSLDMDKPALLALQPVDLTIELVPGTGQQWNRVLDGLRLPAMRGSGTLALTGTPQDPDVSMVATVEVPPKVRGADWLGADVDLRTRGRALELESMLRQGTEQLATLRGSAAVALDRVSAGLLGSGPAMDMAAPATWVSDLDLALTPLALRIEALSGFLAIPDGIVGTVDGEVHLRGSPTAPVLDGKLALVDGELNDLEVTSGTVAFATAPGGYKLGVDLGFGAEGDLKVAGFVPVELEGGRSLQAQMALPGLTLEVGGSGLPLRA